MELSRAKKVFHVSLIIIITACLYGIFESVAHSYPSVPKNWPWGYVYITVVCVFAFTIVMVSLKKYDLLKNKISYFRIFAFFLIWIVIEDISYWIVKPIVSSGNFVYPFPVSNWWPEYFFLAGDIFGKPFLFDMPLGYFILGAIFVVYLFWDLKLSAIKYRNSAEQLCFLLLKKYN